MDKMEYQVFKTFCKMKYYRFLSIFVSELYRRFSTKHFHRIFFSSFPRIYYFIFRQISIEILKISNNNSAITLSI